MENECPLFFLLKNHNFVDDFKDYSHLVYNRQVRVDDKIVDTPQFKIDKSPKKLQVGLRVVNTSKI